MYPTPPPPGLAVTGSHARSHPQDSTMSPLAGIGALFAAGGMVATFVVQRRLERALHSAPSNLVQAHAESARVGLFGVALGVVAFVGLGTGARALGVAVGVLCAGRLLSTAMNWRAAAGHPEVRRLEVAALAGSWSMFLGAALFLTQR